MTLTYITIQLCQSGISLVWSGLDFPGIPFLGLHLLLSSLELQTNGAVPCTAILLLSSGVVPSEMGKVNTQYLMTYVDVL